MRTEVLVNYLPSDRGGFSLNPLTLIARLRESVTPQDVKDRNEAVRRIEETGGVTLLVKQAAILRGQGDESAIVVEGGFMPHFTIQLLWDLRKREHQGTSSWWESRGIAIEATNQSKPVVRFTNGSSWDYLHMVASTPYELERHQRRVGNLEPLDIVMLEGMRQNDLSLDKQLQLARKLAGIQSDYRYGQGDASKHQRPDSDYRIIYPNPPRIE